MSKPPYEFRGNAYRSLAELEPWIAARQEPILEPELPIIDPHHHVWDGERGRYLVHELAADVRRLGAEGAVVAAVGDCVVNPQQRLYFLPLLHGQGEFRPILSTYFSLKINDPKHFLPLL